MDTTSGQNRIRLRRIELGRALVVAVALSSAACAGHSGQSEASGPVGAGEISLVVENHHWNDVIVYILHDGVADRVGLVTAVKTSTFVIPSRRLGTSGLIQLRGHAVGAPDDHTTDKFLVQPGQQIQWTLESDLARSSVAVH